MKYQGIFKDINNNNIEVVIESAKGGNKTITVGESGLYFAADPITISVNNDDLFNVVIRKQAEINFVTHDYQGENLFANNDTDISVKIYKNNIIIFDGYVDPNTYNQPFAGGLDEFTINCIDKLSVLQYTNYDNTTINDYDTKKINADSVTLDTIIKGILGNDTNIYYDLSKGVISTNTIFNDISISELNMLGNDFDDIWSKFEVLENILQYLNLHIIQNGSDYYIFDWESVINRNKNWINLKDNQGRETTPSITTITQEMFGDSSTNISIDEVYTQLKLKCKLEKQDKLFDNPLDKNSLKSLYTNKELYMTELISSGSGDDANNAFNKMVKGDITTFKDAKRYDWYFQVLSNPNWKFYVGDNTLLEDTFEKENGVYINQWKIPKYLKDNQIKPAIIRFGSVDKKVNMKDNSPVSKLNMTDYLVISVNGNEYDDTTEPHSPSDETLETNSPILEYNNNNAGGAVFSPIDNDSTNYLVFSGKILLQPIQYESSTIQANRSNNYEEIRNGSARKTEGTKPNTPYYDGVQIVPYQPNVVSSDDNEQGRYYTRKFYTFNKPTDTEGDYLKNGDASLQPWTTDKSAHGYKYKYSAIGNGTDLISKLPIFECELIIGDKRLIETNIDEYGNSTFQWVKIGNEPTATYIDDDGTEKTYTITTFSLGINPKVDDYIIGDEFNIQNTISYQMGIDAEGTAIPIKKDDRLSGKVTFKIIGLINSLYNQVTRRHPTFFKHTKWTETSRYILAHTENIYIKEFSCEIHSNNLYDYNGGDEITYVSAENTNYLNKKDDLEFKFVTALTSQEALEKNINPSVNLNNPINNLENLPLTDIYNKWETDNYGKAKPEEHYINEYYLFYNKPKTILNVTFHNDNYNLLSVFEHRLLGKNYFPLSYEWNLRTDKINLNLREI